MKTQNDPSSGMEPEDDLEDELRPEYDRADLKNGVRGKYFRDSGGDCQDTPALDAATAAADLE